MKYFIDRLEQNVIRVNLANTAKAELTLTWGFIIQKVTFFLVEGIADIRAHLDVTIGGFLAIFAELLYKIIGHLRRSYHGCDIIHRNVFWLVFFLFKYEVFLEWCHQRLTSGFLKTWMVLYNCFSDMSGWLSIVFAVSLYMLQLWTSQPICKWICGSTFKNHCFKKKNHEMWRTLFMF